MRSTKLLSVLFVVTGLAFQMEGCRPPLDNCSEGAHRCSPSGIPQECHEKRWHNGDRPCAENTVAGGGAPVCCETNSPYAGRILHACVPQALCITYNTDAGTGDVQ